MQFYREANQIAAAIISAAANGDTPKIWDLIEGYEYALQELEERQNERQRRQKLDSLAEIRHKQHWIAEPGPIVPRQTSAMVNAGQVREAKSGQLNSAA